MVYLLGGGQDICEELKESILENFKGLNSILFIPSDPEDRFKTEKYSRENFNIFKELGIELKSMEIIERSDSQETIKEKFSRASFIYIMGGDTVKLLSFIKEKKLKEHLEGYYGNIVGMSAGALALCPSCVLTTDKDIENARVIEGLGLVPINVEVHYDKENEKQRGELLNLVKEHEVENIYAIPEECSILVDSDDIRFLGNKELYRFYPGGFEKVF